MKKRTLISITLVMLLTFFGTSSFAAVTPAELEQFTKKTGLTEEELTDYLAVYDLSLNDFESVNELVSYLGDPVTEDSLQTLLTKHNISEPELQDILGGFGESIHDYLFIKDLETTVDFYLQHAEVLVEAERMLSEIGLTEDEIDGLFLHFLSLNDLNLETEMKKMTSNLEEYFSYNEGSKLTTKQQKELLAMYDKMIDLFNLTPKYYLLKDGVKQVIAYNDLIAMDSLDNADLLVELYRANEEYLLDIKVSEEMLASDFIIERGEKLLTVATLANEMSISVYGNKLPETASPLTTLLLLGIVLSLLGFSTMVLSKKFA